MNVSESHVLGAGKSWFKMTSKGGKKFVKGKRALHRDIFMFDSYNRDIIYRPNVTRRQALAAIRKDRHLRKLYLERDKLSKKNKKRLRLRKMVLREGAILKTLRNVYVRDPDARQQCIEK
jgi:hypothetical protein